MRNYPGRTACLDHPNFFKVYQHNQPNTRSKALGCILCHLQDGSFSTLAIGTEACPENFNYELFNHNNINIRYWSWNYRGCWHQTCPPIGSHQEIWNRLIAITGHVCPISLLLVTTSLIQKWVICAPAAFLRCGSHFSGSLSGIKP